MLGSGVNASIIEPGIVYGHGAGIPAMLLQAPRTADGALTLIGSGDQRWTSVHVDDLADLYVAVLENAPGGQRYLGVNGHNPTVRELGEAVAGEGKVAGEDEGTTRERLGAKFADALLLDQAASSAKAQKALGWTPTRPTLVEELAAGYAA